MSKKLSTSRRVGILMGLLALVALACNAPIDGNQTPSPAPPTNSAVQSPAVTEPNQGATAEISPSIQVETTTESTPTIASAPSISTETATSLPTFTPIQATSPPDAAATNTPEPTKAATRIPSATNTSSANAGPLNFTYSISWQVDSGNSSIAIATVAIVATGGGGNYQYFRDDLPVSGPNFQYEWATCRANPGSLRVTSGDGQSLKIDYFEQPPCPSP